MSFYKYDTTGKVIRNRSALDCQQAIKDGEEVRVEQSHKDEVNINNIIKKHGADLVSQVAQLQEWQFDDVVGNDFQESMNAIIKARDTFEKVPSKIRKEFDNDPAKFMDFVYNPDNQDKLVEMGLAEKTPVMEPLQVTVVSPEPPPTETPPEGV
jgi:phage internal scaffolding protein